MLAWSILALVVGSLVYSVLAVIGALRYRSVRPAPARDFPPISILRPLAGVDDGLEQNLASSFEQQYPNFEVIFGVHTPDDPAVPVVERLRARYPKIPSRLVVAGQPPYPNAKVFSLANLYAVARHDLIVMIDSDVRVGPDLLSTVAAEFQDPKLGLATCPYRAVPGNSFWSTLEAVGLNTEFMSGLVTARLLDGVKFAVGPTIAARREAIESIGGFDALKDFLAEDFVMGQRAAERGWGVILSSFAIEHRIGSQRFVANVKHRLRWNRSTRRSRPWGYVGQLFTNPLPMALILWALAPSWWPVVAITALFRAAAAWSAAGPCLSDRLTLRLWYLVPLQDVFSFIMWIAGFFGNTVQWRGRSYYLRSDGRFDEIAKA